MKAGGKSGGAELVPLDSSQAVDLSISLWLKLCYHSIRLEIADLTLEKIWFL